MVPAVASIPPMQNDITMPPTDASAAPWTYADAGYSAGLFLLTVVLFLAVLKFRNEFFRRHRRDWRDHL